MRNKISISLAFCAAILLLLMTTSPLVLFNLVPVQAQTTHLSFRTPSPADGKDGCLDSDATLTFHARGTPSSSNPQHLDITSGTFTVTAEGDEQKTYSGNLTDGSYTNNGVDGVENFGLSGTIDNVSNAANCSIEGNTFSIGGPCSTSNDGGTSNSVNIYTHYMDQGQAPVFNTFNGVVECTSSQEGGGGGEDTTTQSSSSSSSTTTSTSITVTTQDRDGDGILDANDNCPNLPNTRCYKEGEDSTRIIVHNNR